LDIIASSEGKLGLPGASRKPSKMVAAAAAALVFCQKGREEERENGELGFVIFAKNLCVKIVNY